MVNVNMIDTMGYGIRRMFFEQRKRFYPLPDFDLSDPERVAVTIYGKVIDPCYTTVLMEREDDLSLRTVILLDRVQKRLSIEKDEAKELRGQGLIEGRYPNVYVAAHLAPTSDDRAQYIRNRAFDDDHYTKMIVKYLKKSVLESENGQNRSGEQSRSIVHGLDVTPADGVYSAKGAIHRTLRVRRKT